MSIRNVKYLEVRNLLKAADTIFPCVNLSFVLKNCRQVRVQLPITRTHLFRYLANMLLNPVQICSSGQNDSINKYIFSTFIYNRGILIANWTLGHKTRKDYLNEMWYRNRDNIEEHLCSWVLPVAILFRDRWRPYFHMFEI